MWRFHITTVAVTLVVMLSDRGHTIAQKDDASKKSKVAGSIEFKGAADIEADTIARITLQDVSVADAPAKKLAEQTIKSLRKFPIHFEVEYDPADIRPGRTYAIQVRIESAGRLAYINDTRIEVISRGKPATDVKVPVIRVQKGKAP